MNGKTITAAQACIRASNHAYRYGDGLFETMRVEKGRISLADLHFERLWRGLNVLKFDVPEIFTQKNLEQEVIELCKKNSCLELGRVRLSISGGNGGLYDSDEKFQWVIECWRLQKETDEWNKNGLIIDVFPGAQKSCDVLSNLKTANHLIYVMAARFAKENKLNDCFVMNIHGRVCDTTMANVFWVEDKTIFTPPLTEGCIAGVKRKYLLHPLNEPGYEWCEKICEISSLENADEVFLTNAIRGIMWVKQFRDKVYTNKVGRELCQHAQLQKQ